MIIKTLRDVVGLLQSAKIPYMIMWTSGSYLW